MIPRAAMATDAVRAEAEASDAREVAHLATLYSKLCSSGVVLTGAWLLPHGRVELQRSVCDADEDRKRTFRYCLRRDDKDCPMPSELPPTVTAVVPSPSGRQTVRILKQDKAQKQSLSCLELWRGGSLLIRLDSSGIHGDVLTGDTFGGFNWSPSEQQVVFVAEVNVPAGTSVFSAHKDPKLAGTAHWYREDWGEQLSMHQLGIFVADFGAGTLRRLNGIPPDHTPSQPIFWGDNSIVYAAWPEGARRLGATYCTNRVSKLYAAPLPNSSFDSSQQSPNHTLLTPGLRLARSPRASSRSGEANGPLVFLASSKGYDTHMGCMELYVLDKLGGTPRCLVPSVDLPMGAGEFAGIYMPDALPSECCAQGHVFFNAPLGAVASVWRVPLVERKAPVRVPPPRAAEESASLSLLAANQEGLLLSWSSPDHPTAVLVRPLPSSETSEEVLLPGLGACSVVAGLASGASDMVEGLEWEVLQIPVGDIPGTTIDAVLVRPKEVLKPGLILNLHGGPHSLSSTAFAHSVAFLAKAVDCAVLLVNYRGSAGFGQKMLESLPGKVGCQDVQDCMAALENVLETGDFDDNRVAVVGGSHGGFLTAHLIAQHADTFKAAAMRNPVTNIATMTTATDIPDWTMVEGCGLATYNFEKPMPASGERLATMWSKSPCAHVSKITTPTLLALGLQDKRVPPSQGIEFYHSLKAQGVPTRLLCYASENHKLEGAAADADHWVNVAMWIGQHMPVAPPPETPSLCRLRSHGV
eukprot:TRINITY_DN36705_c0_g1_i2.p1 TRINITY_DN36705_c0_g1~~TRINITY_DN36705_c0_g1_i2.p1  ORF type:complete len:753 (+),score=117.32 TRINITY_DN36705_c0_g1_i2:8-2266(+)